MTTYTQNLCDAVRSLSATHWRIEAVDLGDFVLGTLKDFYDLKVDAVFTHEELCEFVNDFCDYLEQVADQLRDSSMLDGGVSAPVPVCSNNPYDHEGYSFSFDVTDERITIRTTYVDRFGAANFRYEESIVFRAI